MTHKQKQVGKSSHNRIKANMVLNLFSFLFLKLPMTVFGLVSYFYNLNDYYLSKTEQKLFSTICSYFRICNSLTEISIFIFLISFLFEIFILTKVDKHFRIHIIKHVLLNIKKEKEQC